MKIDNFYNKEYLLYANYDNYRSIASYIDGNKSAARKALYLFLRDNLKSSIKVASAAARVVDKLYYLHGNVSLEGVLVGLAQNYTGSNNINLLYPDGNFGSRLVQEAAASRYISTYKESIIDKIFIKEDLPVLIEQEFEGEQIEPKYFVPIIPMLLVNGSEGIGNGFAQKILPRDPLELIKGIKNLLNGKNIKNIPPSYRGFKGEITKVDNDNGWIIKGKIERVRKTEIKIIELPIGYDLQQYIKVLDKLEEDKIIKSYKDFSQNNTFKFVVKVSMDFSENDDENILALLKLVKRERENFTCIDENNSIIEFNNTVDIIESFLKIRLDYYFKRKQYQINLLQKELKVIKNKILFLRGIFDGTIIVNQKNKNQITDQLQEKKFDQIDDSYDYLLNMNIYSLTKERYNELVTLGKNKNLELKELKNTNEKDMYIKELDILTTHLK